MPPDYMRDVLQPLARRRAYNVAFAGHAYRKISVSFIPASKHLTASTLSPGERQFIYVLTCRRQHATPFRRALYKKRSFFIFKHGGRRVSDGFIHKHAPFHAADHHISRERRLPMATSLYTFIGSRVDQTFHYPCASLLRDFLLIYATSFRFAQASGRSHTPPPEPPRFLSRTARRVLQRSMPLPGYRCRRRHS